MIQKQPSQVLFIIAGTLTIVGAVAQLFDFEVAPYVFSVGAGLLIYTQFMIAWGGRTAEKRQQRLGRIGFLSSLLLVIAAYYMFTGSNLWVVAVLIYGLSSFSLTFRGN